MHSRIPTRDFLGIRKATCARVCRLLLHIPTTPLFQRLSHPPGTKNYAPCMCEDDRFFYATSFLLAFLFFSFPLLSVSSEYPLVLTSWSFNYAFEECVGYAIGDPSLISVNVGWARGKYFVSSEGGWQVQRKSV